MENLKRIRYLSCFKNITPPIYKLGMGKPWNMWFYLGNTWYYSVEQNRTWYRLRTRDIITNIFRHWWETTKFYKSTRIAKLRSGKLQGCQNPRFVFQHHLFLVSISMKYWYWWKTCIVTMKISPKETKIPAKGLKLRINKYQMKKSIL